MRYRDLFRNREFTAIYIADIISSLSSSLARVAIAVLIYERTHSTAWTASALAISYAPYLFSPLLSTIGDHFPRKNVLLICEAARGFFVALILIKALPIALILVLIFVVECFTVGWGSARLPLIADLFPIEHFPIANALLQSTSQAVQLTGYLAGGLVTAAVGSYATIGIDAATYWVSGLMLAFALVSRPAPTPTGQASWEEGSVGSPVESRSRDPRWRQLGRGAGEGLRLVARTPRMRYLLTLLGVGPGVAVVAEGLAVPLAHQLGHGTELAGLIMAMEPLGSVLGLVVISRLAIGRDVRSVVPLAIGSALSVAAAGTAAWLGGSVVLLLVFMVLAGFFLAYLNTLQSQIVRLIPDHLRGRMFGLANAILQLSQGGAIAAAGLVASNTAPGPALVLVAVVGLVVVALVGTRLVRDTRVPNA